MKFAWITDVHLNFMDEPRVKRFLDSVREHDSDVVFCTGDIAEGPSLQHYLTLMDEIIAKPIYYVLGNHDFWDSSVAHTHATYTQFLNGKTFLRWMPKLGVVKLQDKVAVIGHECWYDCGYGNWENSGFIMADWKYQADYRGCRTKQDIVDRSRQMAMSGVQYLAKQLGEAVKDHDKVIILTHFPPFAETHVYRNQPGEAHALPYFTNRLLGEMLLQAAKTFPNKQFIVFAGHTHGRVSKQIQPNLFVHVGGAEYGDPQIQDLQSI